MVTVGVKGLKHQAISLIMHITDTITSVIFLTTG